MELKEGRDYKIRVTIDEPWLDATLPADPTGLTWGDVPWSTRVVMASAVLSRRFWSEDWFALMGSIGRARENAFRVDAKRVTEDPASPDHNGFDYTFHAWRSGRLHLFVNDAISPFGSGWPCRAREDFKPDKPWNCYYANNKGTASIEVEEIRER